MPGKSRKATPKQAAYVPPPPPPVQEIPKEPPPQTFLEKLGIGKSDKVIIENRTPRTLVIKKSGQDVLVLAPLEQRRMKKIDLLAFVSEIETYKRLGVISESEVSKPFESLFGGWGYVFSFIFWFALFYGIVWLVIWLLQVQISHWWVLLIVFVLTIMVLVKNWMKTKEDITGQQLRRILAHYSSLAIVIGISFGVPIALFYLFGGGFDLFAGQSPSILGVALGPDEVTLTLLGRITQLVLVGILACLPALLYYLFDRFRMETLRTQFYHDVFRLDPEIRIRTHVDARYGDLIREVFGSESEARGRFARGTSIPVLLATAVITLGWVLAFILPNLDSVVLQTGDFFALFNPAPKAVVFAFLGAYFLSIVSLSYRYARGDLKPKAYTYVAMRILMAVMLAWILQLGLPDGDPTTLTYAFIIGIFPERAIMVLRETRPWHWIGSKFFKALENEHPVTNLQGVGLVEGIRLREEGITTVQSLAHYNLVELFLQTRIPPDQLVDWVDQGILYIHLAAPSQGKIEDEQEPLQVLTTTPGTQAPGGIPTPPRPPRAALPPDKQSDPLYVLRWHGIRNASSLIKSYTAACLRDEKKGDGKEVGKFLRILDGTDSTGESQKTLRMQVLIDTLLGKKSLVTICYWRMWDEKIGPLTLENGKVLTDSDKDYFTYLYDSVALCKWSSPKVASAD